MADTTDAAEYHESPVRHTPQWTRQGYSNGQATLWSDCEFCWCGAAREAL